MVSCFRPLGGRASSIPAHDGVESLPGIGGVRPGHAQGSAPVATAYPTLQTVHGQTGDARDCIIATRQATRLRGYAAKWLRESRDRVAR